MTETKPGTKCVGKGEGATVELLVHALKNIELSAIISAKTNLIRLAMQDHDYRWNTNLALTGEPLTSEDLKRISECK